MEEGTQAWHCPVQPPVPLGCAGNWPDGSGWQRPGELGFLRGEEDTPGASAASGESLPPGPCLRLPGAWVSSTLETSPCALRKQDSFHCQTGKVGKRWQVPPGPVPLDLSLGTSSLPAGPRACFPDMGS